MSSKSRDADESLTLRTTYTNDVLTEAHPSSSFKARLDSFTYSQRSTTSSNPRPNDNMPNTRSGRVAPAVKVEPELSSKLASRKRASDDEGSEHATPQPATKKKRSTTKQRAAADPHNPENNLVDSLRPGLTLVFIGLNPGLMTAATGCSTMIYSQ